MVAVSRLPGVRVFRNNVGMGWAGETTRMRDNTIIIKNPRPLHAGLCTGSSDLIGWTEITITPQMVGKKLAVFTAIETKTNKGRGTKDQINFIEVVRKHGGFAGIARTEIEAEGIINYYTRTL
jgi:hypothetical protein